jgi:signal transduction histidine kinase
MNAHVELPASDNPTAWPDRRAPVPFALWWLAGTATVVVALFPGVHVASWRPSVATAICAVAASIGLMLFQLGVLHFRAVGRPLELLVGIGFGVLGVANVICAVLASESEVPIARLQFGSQVMLCAHTLADAMFAIAVLDPGRRLLLPKRAQFALIWSAGPFCVLAIATAILFQTDGGTRGVLSARAMALLEQGNAASQLVGDQSAWLVATNVLLTLLMAGVAWRLRLLARSMQDAYVYILSLGMIPLVLAQAHAVLFPVGAPGYVSTADAFRFTGYVALLLGLTSRMTTDLVSSASAVERMRLSRELHDGLAQQLMTLKLRLSQMLDATGAVPDGLRGNLEICHRLTQDALLEARQAITSLRSGLIPWDTFVDAVDAFCNEAAENHGISITVRVDGRVPTIDTGLQLEVLRILNETISNAVRHGEATHVEVAITTTARPEQLVLHVRDDGRGFRGGQSVETGIGMQSLNERLAARGGSMNFESSSTHGTTVRANVPFGDRLR